MRRTLSAVAVAVLSVTLTPVAVVAQTPGSSKALE